MIWWSVVTLSHLLTVWLDPGVDTALGLVVGMVALLYQVVNALAGRPEDNPGAAVSYANTVDS